MKPLLLISLAVSALIACGETRLWRLQYELAPAATQEAPGLVLGFRLDVAEGGGFQWTPSFESSDLAFSASVLGPLLVACAIDLGQLEAADFPTVTVTASSCQEMGLNVGQELLGAQAFEPDTDAELQVSSGVDYFFVVFIYSPDEVSVGADRCAQLVALSVVNEALSAAGGNTGRNLTVELPNRLSSNVDPQQNCFPLQ